MNKMFFALMAALPFIAGCWPFSTKVKEQPNQEMMIPASKEATPSDEEMKEEAKEETASDEEEEMSEDK
jgi:hypothetical protein